MHPNKSRSQDGMTRHEMLVLLSSVFVGFVASAHFSETHHWILGIISLLLGFFSTIMAIALSSEPSTRKAKKEGKAGALPIQNKDLFQGTAFGIAIGMIVAFSVYHLAINEVIPTNSKSLALYQSTNNKTEREAISCIAIRSGTYLGILTFPTAFAIILLTKKKPKV